MADFGPGRNECFSAKSTVMNRPFTSGAPGNRARLSGIDLAYQSQPPQPQRTLSAMSDFEQQIDRADQQ